MNGTTERNNRRTTTPAASFMRFKQIKAYFKDNSAEEYIPALISTTLILIISVIVICVASSINVRLRLDEKLDDISKMVEQTGFLDSDAIITLENQLEREFGGNVTFNGEIYRSNASEGGHYVQLNKAVVVNYHNDNYTAVSIGTFSISTEVNLSKSATATNYIRGLQDYSVVDSYSHG